VALEVEEVLAPDVADLPHLEVLQTDAASLEPLGVVELREIVDRGPLVPECPVGLHVVVLGGHAIS
jgi:hypothetical protein